MEHGAHGRNTVRKLQSSVDTMRTVPSPRRLAGSRYSRETKTRMCSERPFSFILPPMHGIACIAMHCNKGVQL